MENTTGITWEIESLRLTSFLKDNFDGSNLENWLTQISGTNPLSVSKRINYFQGLAQVDLAMLKLEWNLNRIDVILNSNAPSIETNIGSDKDIVRLMDEFVLKIITMPHWPLSSRLAIGIVLNAPIETTEEGIEFIQPKLKSVSNLKGSSDFLFRINKPIQSNSVHDLKLNRLMTWSIGQLQVFNIPINIGQPNLEQPNILPIPQLQNICRLEIDFSSESKADVSLLVPDQELIVDEMLQEAINTMEKGELGMKQ